MQWVETTGRTVDEAKDRALDQLGVAEDDAEFEILEEPRAGIFGRLRGEARVRARVRPTKPRAKVERRNRRSSRPERREKVGTDKVAAGVPAPATKAARPKKRATPERTPVPRPAPSPPIKEPDMSDQRDLAVTFLAGLLESFSLEGRIDTAVDGDDCEVRVHGTDLGLLIGPRGLTLAAIQDLTRLAAQREGREGRLSVDVSGYRERRRQALERFTRQIASEVEATGEARVLEPMSAADRKIVHDTAATIPGVASASEGEDPARRVVIRPAE